MPDGLGEKLVKSLDRDAWITKPFVGVSKRRGRSSYPQSTPGLRVGELAKLYELRHEDNLLAYCVGTP